MENHEKLWKKMAIELNEALSRCDIDCKKLNHRSHEFHDAVTSCPACTMIEAAKDKFLKLLKESK